MKIQQVEKEERKLNSQVGEIAKQVWNSLLHTSLPNIPLAKKRTYFDCSLMCEWGGMMHAYSGIHPGHTLPVTTSWL